MPTAADSTSGTPGDASLMSPPARRNVTFSVGANSKSTAADYPSRSSGAASADMGSVDAFLTPAAGAAAGSAQPSVSCHPHVATAHNSLTDESYTEAPCALSLFTLTREEVQAAFDFFDTTGTGVLTMSTLKQRLSAFYPNLTSKEYRFLLEDPTPVGGNIGDAPSSASSSADGFTAGHLWELIDTYQRLYVSEGATATSMASATSSVSHRSPRRRASQSARAHSVTAPGGSNNRNHNRSRNNNSGTTGSHAASASSGRASSSSRDAGWATPNGGAASPLGLSLGSHIQIFDPVTEAFRVFDPTGKKHCVDVDVLAQIMARIGYGELSDAELRLLVRTADFDGDGRISLDDFRHLVSAKGRRGAAGGGGSGRKEDSSGSDRRAERDGKFSPTLSKRR